MRFYILIAIGANSTFALNERAKRSHGGQYYNDYQDPQAQYVAQQAQYAQSRNHGPNQGPNQPDEIPERTSGQFKSIYYVNEIFCLFIF